MTLKITKILFVLCCVIMGVIWVDYFLGLVADDMTDIGSSERNGWRIVGGGSAALVGLTLLFGLRFVTQDLFERIFPVIIAIAFSMMLGYFAASYIMLLFPNDDPTMRVFLTSTLVLLFGYVGITLGLTRASNWESLVSAVKERQFKHGSPKLVDTSVLIDGRLAEIVETGFMDGTLIIPRFVLRELQHISDSRDDSRRVRGRRGLDVLKQIQEDISHIAVEIVEDDPPNLESVDEKLVYLARQYHAKILTTDFNLNKVAQIEGINVLNVNDLANAMKPAALQDEVLQVKIVKEGKEALQGVGYLDDGTMIVVDGGRDYLGQQVSVEVTSVLQTAAGRMIFTRLQKAS